MLAATGAGAAAAAAGGALNISANGLPNCKRSSDALAGAGADTPPNMSTILALELVGDDKNGLLIADDVGDATFVCRNGIQLA